MVQLVSDRERAEHILGGRPDHLLQSQGESEASGPEDKGVVWVTERATREKEKAMKEK